MAVEFGFFPSPNAADLDAITRRVKMADNLGLDLVGIQDHPYQARFVDTMALIAGLAAQTERIRFFPDVTSLPLRPPAVLANQAATIDLMSGGRFELGLGAGSFWDAIAAIGGPRRTPGEALAALREAIDVIRLMWSAERGLRYLGEHYQLEGVHGGPAPAHDIGIWIGGAGPRMLRLIGERADGWVPSMPYLPPSKLAELHRRIDEGAEAAGRHPSEIRRIYNVVGVIGDVTDDAENSIVGPPSVWVDRITEIATNHGMDGFIMWADGDEDEQIERFATEVAPVVRERLN